MSWYQRNTEQLYEILQSSDKGLSESEASRRRKKFGPNQLALKRTPLWQIILEPFRSVFVGVLILAAVVSLISHEPLDAAIISTIVIINAVIFYSQQYATTLVLRSLNKHSIQEVLVMRDGKEQSISSIDLVPGDIITLNEGDKVAADARIVHTDNLQVNESSLTGESVPVYKHASTLDSTKQLYEQDNMAFQGTYILSGTAKALVVETGANTEFGKIAKLAGDNTTKSPVQEKIDHLITVLIKIVGGVAIVVFLLSLLRGIPPGEALRFMLSLTVSAAPEGLPVALTVIIVLGMRRMAKQKALVRSFKAIEDIGLVTTIATDKTGTLTKNHLSSTDSWSIGKTDVLDFARSTIDGKNDQADPLDQAIKEITSDNAVPEVTKLYPFDLSLRMSGAYVREKNIIYIKGSPEHILAKSSLAAKQRHEAESMMHQLASKGYRVIAFGSYKVPAKMPMDLSVIKDKSLDFVGFIAFADELRPEAASAISAAHDAGISVRLITGDHFETAYNIGKQIGLATHPNQVIQGTELPEKPSALTAVIKDKTVFARILPKDKFRILKALKQTDITAMTGDGVNDVPALANAHVGIAMGSGSDIARDAGGIVLLDDNFKTIIQAISEGRKIFDNIRRMLFYLLSSTLGEVLTMIGALIFGLPLPVTAIQILWINLVTDTAMVLPLGLEPEEEGQMTRPPRKSKDPLLNRILIERMVIIAFTMAIITLLIVYILDKKGYDTPYIQTVAFMTLIAAQWMNAFNARSESHSSFSRVKKMNYGLIVGFVVAVFLQTLVMYGPLANVFNIQPVDFNVLLICSGIMAVTVLAVSEIHKFAVSKNW